MRFLKTIAGLNQAFAVNTWIYRLRKVPLIGRRVPASLYADRRLKQVTAVLSLVWTLFAAVIGKFLYFGLMVYLPSGWFPGDQAEQFLHLMTVFTVVGAFVNAELFSATKEKYYAVILMRADARRYALTENGSFLLLHALTFLPAALVTGRMAGVPAGACLLMPVFALAVKTAGNGLRMLLYEKREILWPETDVKSALGFMGTALLAGYGPLFAGAVLPAAAFWAAAAVSVLLAVPGGIYVWNSKSFRRLYRQLVTPNTVIFQQAEQTAAIQQRTYQKRMSAGKVDTGNKKGYEYFNAVFAGRHRRILTKAAHRVAVMAAALTAAGAVLLAVRPETAAVMNRLLMNFLPYFVFVMYVVNRGEVVSQAMFLNCDHSMLTYRFYRKPDVILHLFWVRLRMLVRINLVPAAVIGGGLSLLLFLSGGTDNPLNYALLPTAILAMSVFFSIHHLTLYYLLQPYNVQMQARGFQYGAANMGTYFLCCLCMRVQVPTFFFAALTIAFAAGYAALALILVYRYAPKRFRLKS